MLNLNEKGQSLTEYIILLVLVSLVTVGAAKSVGKTIRNKMETARSHILSDINFAEVK
jgi:Flp pilus assembly pilin Flp